MPIIDVSDRVIVNYHTRLNCTANDAARNVQAIKSFCPISGGQPASACDYLRYLVERKEQRRNRTCRDAQLTPDDEPLTEDELRQLNGVCQ